MELKRRTRRKGKDGNKKEKNKKEGKGTEVMKGARRKK